MPVRPDPSGEAGVGHTADHVAEAASGTRLIASPAVSPDPRFTLESHVANKE